MADEACEWTRQGEACGGHGHRCWRRWRASCCRRGCSRAAPVASRRWRGRRRCPPSPRRRPSTSPEKPARQPNIVLVLMDDFSMDLLPTMRSAEAMRSEGASYPNSFVVDSLCCVSRTSLFTGQYPHQTGVRVNSTNSLDPASPLGGYEAFQAYGNGKRTFAVRLQKAGYTTGFVGKFLNRYEYVPGGEVPPPPPGWSSQHAVRVGVRRLGLLADLRRGRRAERPRVPRAARRREPQGEGQPVRRHGHPADRARLHRRPRRRPQPWFLEVAPYALTGGPLPRVPTRATLPSRPRSRSPEPAAAGRELWPAGLR